MKAIPKTAQTTAIPASTPMTPQQAASALRTMHQKIQAITALKQRFSTLFPRGMTHETLRQVGAGNLIPGTVPDAQLMDYLTQHNELVPQLNKLLDALPKTAQFTPPTVQKTGPQPKQPPAQGEDPGRIESFIGGFKNPHLTYEQWSEYLLTPEQWIARHPGKTEKDFWRWRRTIPYARQNWVQRWLGMPRKRVL